MMFASARVGRRVLVVLTGLLLAVAPVFAQAPPDQATSDPEPAPNYVFPDLPARALIDGEHFWIRPIFAFVGDYTTFSQDEASLAQVGEQKNARELRAGRLGITIRSKGKVKWDFYTTVDYQEARTREGAVFELFDLRIGIPIGPVKVTVGKQKEPFVYELGALSVILPQQERILLPFFPTRSIGVNLSGLLAHDRMTWEFGAFNDWLSSGLDFKRNATDYVGRVSALAWESPGKTEYLHLGLGFRNAGPDDGMMRFAGRPESNVADKFVDTKDFAARRARIWSFEGLGSHGPFSLLTEYISAWVDAPDSGDPHFSGYYVEGSWILTGESRRYLRTQAYAGAILPKRRLGAVEVVTRYSQLNLTSGPIDGGLLNKWHFGLNWWASSQWKIGLSYGDADLVRAGLRGNTTMLLTRIQWLY
jgi:phosphate-selective porin OprO and OprP